jgi:16S rRNA (cytosine967-C5)-methyltransferase
MTPTATPPPDPRGRALKALVACYDGTGKCADLLDAWQSAQPLSRADAALAAELTIGLSRHRITAEHLASKYYRGRWQGLRPSVRTILSLAVYQLCWLDRVPDHAAVSHAVRQAKRHGRGIAATVNAILRTLIADRGPLVGDEGHAPPRRFLSLDGARGRVFTRDLFPDPTRRPLEYLAAAYGYPPFLVERWHRRFKPALCRQICQAGRVRPPLTLRPNRLRVTPKALHDRLAAAGRAVRMVDDSGAVVLIDAPPACDVAEIGDGLCQPQDATSQAALLIAPPRPGEFVLDFCAGAGTKATQSAELMGDDGVVMATDIDERRLQRIAASADRLGISIIQTTPIGSVAEAIEKVGRPPDLILVDAPCSNTGVLARRPEARFRATFQNLTAMVRTQAAILHDAASFTADGTRIIYSTCSIETEENNEQMRRFIETHPQWRFDRDSLMLPDPQRSGGYTALIRRK